MSAPFAPSWALIAEALDGAGDTHLPFGIHVRALPSPTLGLPATPLVVTRRVFPASLVASVAHTSGVIWTDSKGNNVQAPFTVSPGNPVTGHIVAGDAIWARLDAQAAPGATLRFETLHNSAQGVAPSQSKSGAPYALAGSRIKQVRVSGGGTVSAIHWVHPKDFENHPDEVYWKTWSLPVKPALRYTPTANPFKDAAERMVRASVRRQPMHVAYASTEPKTAPAATPADALKRMDQVRPQLDRWLNLLLNTVFLPTHQVRDRQTLDGKIEGNIQIAVEPFLLLSAIDPDVGQYLGLGDADQSLKEDGGALVLYRVRGLWRWLPDQWSDAERPSFAAAVRADTKDAVSQFPLLESLQIVPAEVHPFVDLSALAVAIVGQAPDRPPAVALASADDRGWMSAPLPPRVRRGLRVTAYGFLPHSLAALAATDQGVLRSLHAFPNKGRMGFDLPAPAGLPLPWVASRMDDPIGPGSARFEDRHAPGGAVDYRLAQCDWFGRWSGWAGIVAPPKKRSPPMAPVIEISIRPPALPAPPGAIPTGPLSGLIDLRIPVPELRDVPPGGAALAWLELIELFDGGVATTIHYTLDNLSGAKLLPCTVSKRDLLAIERTGPALQVAQKKLVTYTAIWHDELGAPSALSFPAKRTIVDPRAPAPPPLIETLTYTARPDSQGHARVDLAFTGQAGARYRVYASNETLLLQALVNMGKPELAKTIKAMGKIESRVAELVKYKELFSWDHFESLNKEALIGKADGNLFVHRVSGALKVAVFYRVIGEGESGMLSDLNKSFMAPFGVPNRSGPARPLLSVLNGELEPTTHGVVLRVVVAEGEQPLAWRLRRTNTQVDDPMRVQIVDQGPVGTCVKVDGGIAFDIASYQPLKAWRQYRFAVEVQADRPSGAPATLRGEWSEASAQARLVVIAPQAPPPPDSITVYTVSDVLHVEIRQPDPDIMHGTSVGTHQFEAWRVEPGQRPKRLTLPFNLIGDYWLSADPGAPPAPGTYVTVRVIDPAGRTSAAAISNTL